MFIKFKNNIKSAFFNKKFKLRYRRRRRAKKFKKHAESFFNFWRKNFSYYHKRGQKGDICELNKNKNQIGRKHKVAVRGLRKYYLTKKPLVAYIKLTKRFANSFKFKYSFRSTMAVFPNFTLTSKPKSVRMGKGKGEVSKNIYFLKIGKLLGQLHYKRRRNKLMKNDSITKYFYHSITNKLIRKLTLKLPIKAKILKNIW